VGGRARLTKCPYAHCLPSHLLATDGWLPEGITLAMIGEQNDGLARPTLLERTPALACGSHVDNRSLIWFADAAQASQAMSASHATLHLGFKHFNLSQAYWTTDWTAPNSFPMDEYLILTDLPTSATESKVKGSLPAHFNHKLRKVWIAREAGVAVAHMANKSDVLSLLETTDGKIEVGDGAVISVFQANLIPVLPEYADDEAALPSRFADRDQLRYSMRSLEKYAPWVRRVYLVTNGQIPHWLDLEHPRVSVVSHEEIFDDGDCLPPFSSPAIEANLHKIPGLSDRFLYFNDDFFLSKPVLPDDFYSSQSGFKMRLAWPLPDCSPNCPSSWIKDGYCDMACNTTACMHDGGDCLGSSPVMGFVDVNEEHVFHGDAAMEDPFCSPSCLDSWLADSFCDDVCDVAECGFDAGDCGHVEIRFKAVLDEIKPSYDTKLSSFDLQLPAGSTVGYWNVSGAFEAFDEVGLAYNDVGGGEDVVRALHLSDTHKMIVLVLRANVTKKSSLSFTLQGKKNETTWNQSVLLTFNSNNHRWFDTKYDHFIGAEGETSTMENKLPLNLEQARSENVSVQRDYRNLNVALLNVNKEDEEHLSILHQQLEDDELTVKGFNVKAGKLLQPYLRRYTDNGGRLSDLGLSSNANTIETAQGVRKLLWIHGDHDHQEDEQSANQDSVASHDAYGESLLHVNRLMTQRFGHARREAVAHAPLLIDKAVLTEAMDVFTEEWKATSARKFRSPKDMQFAFSYSYYLMEARKSISAGEIFDDFDTDRSKTWSDREIRTLLARIHPPPLYLDTVKEFEKQLLNCSKHIAVSRVSAPPYERYYDSSLPTISRELVVKCDALSQRLERKFRKVIRYPHVKLAGDRAETAFVRMTSNVTDLVADLDALRRQPSKFVCVNDVTDPERGPDNAKVEAVLVDFMEVSVENLLKMK